VIDQKFEDYARNSVSKINNHHANKPLPLGRLFAAMIRQQSAINKVVQETTHRSSRATPFTVPQKI
jgi:hypothetical protein